MRLYVVFSLFLVSSALALPYSAKVASRDEVAKRGSTSTWYDGFIQVASDALGRTIAPYLTRYSALALAFDIACEPGLGFNPRSMVCEYPTRSLPTPSHPDGHGSCPEDQFWFGPKQSCVGGRNSLAREPPKGYYCPLDWYFSPQLSCCVPNSPEVVSRNSCGNGNGAWDLIRVACAERSTPRA